jgi:hypothetical protein
MQDSDSINLLYLIEYKYTKLEEEINKTKKQEYNIYLKFLINYLDGLFDSTKKTILFPGKNNIYDLVQPEKKLFPLNLIFSSEELKSLSSYLTKKYSPFIIELYLSVSSYTSSLSKYNSVDKIEMSITLSDTLVESPTDIYVKFNNKLVNEYNKLCEIFKKSFEIFKSTTLINLNKNLNNVFVSCSNNFNFELDFKDSFWDLNNFDVVTQIKNKYKAYFNIWYKEFITIFNKFPHLKFKLYPKLEVCNESMFKSSRLQFISTNSTIYI